MAKGKKLSAREQVRAEAMELQACFDAVAAVDPMGVRAVVYGPVFDEALAADADRTFGRYCRTVEMLQREAKMAKAKVDSFAVQLAENPVDAFRWGTDAVTSSAKLEAVRLLLQVLTEKGPVVAKTYALESASRAAREAFPRSTSPMANLVEQARAVAWAELTDGGFSSPRFLFV